MEIGILFFLGWCVSTIVVNGSIFDGFKNYLLVKSPFFSKLFNCIMCTSFWVGALIFSPLLFSNIVNPYFFKEIPFWINYFIFPFLQSGISVIIESSVIFLVKGSGNR